MPQEVTTSFALEEKSKLVKSLRRLDMVGFAMQRLLWQSVPKLQRLPVSQSHGQLRLMA